MRDLTDSVQVGGPLSVADVADFAARGVRTIINNRPDNEEPFQVASDTLAAAAQDNSVTYHHIPMAGGISPDMIARSIGAYASADGPVVAFCKSGTRSTALWCFAHVKELGVDAVLTAAAYAGYQLEQLRAPLSAYLEQSAES